MKQEQPKVQGILPDAVAEKHRQTKQVTLIDVREDSEFAEVSVSYAQNWPLSIFNPKELAHQFAKDTPVYVVCRSGKRSFKAAQLLIEVGFTSVYNVEGGMLAWEAKGLPVVKPS